METPLDAAHAAHAAAPDEPGAHRRFLEAVLDAELHLLLDAEPWDEALEPAIFDLEAGRFALAFDLIDRLAEFLDAPAPYAALSGRRLAGLLAGRGIGIGLNLGPHGSASLLPPGSVDWLAEMAAAEPVEATVRPDRFGAPSGVGSDVLTALSRKLAGMADVIGDAHLVRAEYAAGPSALMLALVDVPPAAQAGVAAAVAETLRFVAGAPACDVAFLAGDAAALGRISRASLRFELPTRAEIATEPGRGPGTDPATPPMLRPRRSKDGSG